MSGFVAEIRETAVKMYFAFLRTVRGLLVGPQSSVLSWMLP